MLQEDRDPQTFILTFHFFKILPSPVPDAAFADISSEITPGNAVQQAKALGPSSARHMGTSAEPSHHPAQSAGYSHMSCSSLHRCLLHFSPSLLLFFFLIPTSFCSIWKMKIVRLTSRALQAANHTSTPLPRYVFNHSWQCSLQTGAIKSGGGPGLNCPLTLDCGSCDSGLSGGGCQEHSLRVNC